MRNPKMADFTALGIKFSRSPVDKVGYVFEWSDIKRDLEALQTVSIEEGGKSFAIRTECRGDCGKIFQAVGVALLPTIREITGA